MHTLSVCRTCPRERPEKGGLAERLHALTGGSLAGFELLSVECLGSCPRPCTVVFDARDKWRVRLSGLTAANAADLVDAARAYAGSPDGRLGDAELPRGLRGHISALSPKYRPQSLDDNSARRSRRDQTGRNA